MTDLAVVGGGPAGLAAATEAARLGLATVLLDEQPAPGGQVYRAVEANAASGKALDADYARGATLAAAFRESGARAEFGASVWSVDEQGEIGWSRDGRAALLRAGRVIVATGALERPVPIPGWTLPGVMTVGAAQILLKTARLAPQGRVWIAGQGPLVWLYAAQALEAGARFAGILDTSSPSALARALVHAPLALAAADQLAKGLRWRRQVGASGVSVRRVRGLAALGEGRLQAIRFDGREEPADLLLLHEGVVPNVQVTQALGIEHDWDPAQRCFRPRVDAFGATSLERILVAGDGAGIAGARAAEFAGRLAALEAARGLGGIDEFARDALAAPILAERRRHLALRPFLDAAFAPPAWLREPADATLVCRCEEVPARALRDAVALGCLGPNQAKAFTRCGMGPCQGRYCGLTATEVIAAARGVSPEAVGYYRLRPPIKPLTLGELASIET